MNKDKTLKISNCINLTSTSLMNQLHKEDRNHNKIYDYLLLENVFKVWKDNTCYNVSLYYGRFVLGDNAISDHFTFTQLKNTFFGKEHFEKNKNDLEITKCTYAALEHLLSLDDDSDEFFFETPVRIRAQNTSDIPSFGDTSDYAIFGAKFSVFFSM